MFSQPYELTIQAVADPVHRFFGVAITDSDEEILLAKGATSVPPGENVNEFCYQFVDACVDVAKNHLSQIAAKN